MGQRDGGLRILVVDPDEVFRAGLATLNIAGTQISLLDLGAVAGARGQLSSYNVIVIGVDMPVGLSLVAELCERPGMPPVIAVGGAGVSGRPAEHVLLQAEMRGAALSLPKPLEAGELVQAATALVGAARARP